MDKSVAAESLEIPDMNYWQSDGTPGTMLELKRESERGKALVRLSVCVCATPSSLPHTDGPPRRHLNYHLPDPKSKAPQKTKDRRETRTTSGCK